MCCRLADDVVPGSKPDWVGANLVGGRLGRQQAPPSVVSLLQQALMSACLSFARPSLGTGMRGFRADNFMVYSSIQSLTKHSLGPSSCLQIVHGLLEALNIASPDICMQFCPDGTVALLNGHAISCPYLMLSKLILGVEYRQSTNRHLQAQRQAHDVLKASLARLLEFDNTW